jgi:gluconate 2-dehydrogenase gamma chain
MSTINRKDFVAAIGTLGAGAALAGPAEPVEAATTTPHHHPTPAHAKTTPKTYAPLESIGEGYLFFTAPESAFVEAAVARLIPADDLGPGAKEAGVAYYIDQQLNGAFGAAAHTYMQGPYAEGLPTQGYQLALTPADVYRIGIAECDAACAKEYGKTFAQLGAAQQDAVLGTLDHGTLAFAAFPSKAFFELLLQNTVEGFFADPIYGGNRDKIGWKLIGFPGVAAAYLSTITQYNKPYTAEPVSMLDLQRETAMLSPEHRLMAEMMRRNNGAEE